MPTALRYVGDGSATRRATQADGSGSCALVRTGRAVCDHRTAARARFDFANLPIGRPADDLGQVRLHADATSAASARGLDPRAHTVGSDIVLGAGQPSPASPAGRQLPGHELAHTAQQAPGAGHFWAHAMKKLPPRALATLTRQLGPPRSGVGDFPPDPSMPRRGDALA